MLKGAVMQNWMLQDFVTNSVKTNASQVLFYLFGLAVEMSMSCTLFGFQIFRSQHKTKGEP